MPLENPSESIPMPARLVERALDLARAEVGLALVHTRRLAVRAVGALLGTIVACAFAQLAIVLLVAWPVLGERVPVQNLIAAVGVSVVLALAGATSAFIAWAGARERKPSAAAHAAPVLDTEQARSVDADGPGPVPDTAVARHAVVARQRRFDTREEPSGATLAERLGS